MLRVILEMAMCTYILCTVRTLNVGMAVSFWLSKNTNTCWELISARNSVCETLKCSSVEVTIGSQKGLLIAIEVSVNTASSLYMHKAFAWYLKSLHYWKSLLKRMPKNMKCSLCLQAFKINMKSKKLIRKGEMVINTSIKQWRKKKRTCENKFWVQKKDNHYGSSGLERRRKPWSATCHLSAPPQEQDTFPLLVNPGLTPAWNPKPTCTLIMLYTGN